MKNLKFVLLASLLLLGACEESRPLTDNKEHPCVGVFDNDAREPNVQYKVSTQNVVVGVLFSESIIVPVVVVLEETYCPVAFKVDTTKKVR